MKISDQELKEDGNKARYNARFPPKSSNLAYSVFGFLQQNDNLTTTVGMEGVATGFNRYYLSEVAKMYGIDMSRYMSMVTEYENAMLKRQHAKYNERKSKKK